MILAAVATGLLLGQVRNTDDAAAKLRFLEPTVCSTNRKKYILLFVSSQGPFGWEKNLTTLSFVSKGCAVSLATLVLFFVSGGPPFSPLRFALYETT